MVCINQQLSDLGGSGGNGVPVKDPAPGLICDLHERPAAFSILPVPALAEPTHDSANAKAGLCCSHGREVRESDAKRVRASYRTLELDSRGGENKFANHNRGRNPRFVLQETSGIRETLRELPISAAEMDLAYRHFWIRRGFAEHEIPSASAWQIYPVEPDEGRILQGYFGK